MDQSRWDRLYSAVLDYQREYEIFLNQGRPFPQVRGSDAAWLFDAARAVVINMYGVTFQTENDYGMADCNGAYDPLRGVIYVRPTGLPNDMARTALHETAHLLHFTFDPFWAWTSGRALLETVAESVAFLVGDHFGYDFSRHSVPYIGSFAYQLRGDALCDDMVTSLIFHLAKQLTNDIERVVACYPTIRPSLMLIDTI